MKEIVFILSSLNDPHYQKRVEAFIEAGYNVMVYGYKRKSRAIQELPYKYTILGEIENGDYNSRLKLYYKTIKAISKKTKNKLCFYSSLDIAIFATRLIKAPYIYEVCDLTELCINNRIIRNLLIRENKRIINRSICTILTSQGFIDFFKDISRNKLFLLPNKVSKNCKDHSIERNFDCNCIKIGFVGVIRFESTYVFIRNCIENCNNIEIHLYGIYSDGDLFSQKIKSLQENYPERIFYHGRFSNPTDLPKIYAEIDLVLSAYPPTPGVIYAEPNKLYEALFFNCPIIVSEGTFLGRKVRDLGVGYVINSMSDIGIKNFIDELTKSSYEAANGACKRIPRQEIVENYSNFFRALENIDK